jgi:hypothetical protein
MAPLRGRTPPALVRVVAQGLKSKVACVGFDCLSLGSLGLGGLVLGDLMTADGDVTTAQSAALFVEPQLAATPIPNTLALMIGGLLFIFGAGKKWGRKEPMSATYGMTAA